MPDNPPPLELSREQHDAITAEIGRLWPIVHGPGTSYGCLCGTNEDLVRTRDELRAKALEIQDRERVTVDQRTDPDEDQATDDAGTLATLRREIASLIAGGRAAAVSRTSEASRRFAAWLLALPLRFVTGLAAADVRLVWALWTIDRSAPGRTAEFLGALDRGVGRRLVAITYASRWDRPLVALHGFRPPLLAVVAAVLWLFGVPGVWGVNTATTVLVSPVVVFLGVYVAAQEYAKTPRARVRGEYGPDGWATYWDLHRAMSRHAVRMAAVDTRPSVKEAVRGEWTDRPAARLVARLPVSQCGTWVGRTAVGPVRPVDLYAAFRDVVGVIAPPQTAKTAWMGGRVIDFPGAAVVTSTKPDLFEYTSELRKLVAHSGDVELFNPEGLGDYPSTFAWSPLLGCDRSYVAAERAGAMVGATSAASGDDGQFWLDSAAKVLRCFLLAAALDGRTMVDVAAWISNATRAGEALEVLDDPRNAHRVPVGWSLELDQVLNTDAKRTRESIFLTLAQSVAFMSDPAVAALCVPGAGEPVFDVEAFLRDRGTLYLIGSERPHASIAPLLAALTTHVFEDAKRVAARSNRKGRLDPPLLLALDEAALITPVPLDRWTADAGGRGIHIVWAVQSPSQLAQRWGARGADTIYNNTNVKLIFGGLTLVDDLDDISRLCGTVPDGEGRRRPLLAPDALRELPQWHAVCIHRNTRPTLVVVDPVWERRDVRHTPPPQPTEPIGNRVARRRIGDHPQEDAT